jgi:hypothetical protein
MSLIREKATESEAVVKNITKDIQVLDLAKKNLVTSMTMMKRLQMLGVYPAVFASIYLDLIIFKLVNALTQMEDLIREKKYSEVSQTLSVSLLVYLQSPPRFIIMFLSGHQANFGVFQIVYCGSPNSSRLETHARNSVSITNTT